MSTSTWTIDQLTRQVLAGQPISRPQARWLVEAVRDDNLDELFAQATQVRKAFTGRRAACCSIVASKVGQCSQNCAFCSQSGHFDTPVTEPVELSHDDVLRAAHEAISNGAHAFGLVNSGLGPSDAEIEAWAPVFTKLREEGRIRVCASLGVLNAAQAHRLAEIGVQHYNHNLQTSRRFFPRIISTHTYDDRLATLRHLKAAGIGVCSGALFGMGETWEDRLDLAFELRGLGPDTVPLNFLIPIPGTPLAGIEPLSARECLKITGIYRLLLPEVCLKIAGGRERQLGDMQSSIFAAGANGFLIGNYLTTCGRSAADDHQMLAELGIEMAPYTPIDQTHGPEAVCPPKPGRPDPTQLTRSRERA